MDFSISLQQQLAEHAQRIGINNQFYNSSDINPACNQPSDTVYNKQNNQTINSNRKCSLIIDYWFRKTNPSTINDDDESKSESNIARKENAINNIIAKYCIPLFRVLPIPKLEHGYHSLPFGASIYPTVERFNELINNIQVNGYYNNKEGLLNCLLSPQIPIIWDEEYVVLIVSNHTRGPQSIDIKPDEYEIDQENNA